MSTGALRHAPPMSAVSAPSQHRPKLKRAATSTRTVTYMSGTLSVTNKKCLTNTSGLVTISARVPDPTVDRESVGQQWAARMGATTLCLDRHVMTENEKNRSVFKLATCPVLVSGPRASFAATSASSAAQRHTTHSVLPPSSR